MKSRNVILLLSALTLSLLSGCATYTETVKGTTEARHSGNTLSAAEQAAKLAKKAADRDAVVMNLEAAAAYRTVALNRLPPPPPPPTAATTPALGGATSPAAASPLLSPEDYRCAPYKQSLHYLSVADEKIDAYEEQAKHSLSAGATVAVTNPQMAPYRGAAYDKIMASTYAALNYLAIGERERARASLNKAYQRQADAVAENEKRIEQDKERIAAAKDGKIADEKGAKAAAFDISKSQDDPKSKATLADINQALDSRLMAYTDYVNPFTVFLDALYMTSCATDRQEQERGAKQFARVAAMNPENALLKDEVTLAEDIAAGRSSMPKTTYVIFESGEAAHREEMTIPIPIFLVANKPLFTQLPLYRLSFNDNYNEAATVSSDDQQSTTATICNMDAVIARDYKNNLSSMWLDALLCAGTKALIQNEVNNRLGSTWGLVAGVINMATTRADTRSWSSLPKTFAYTRVPTPKDNHLTITTPDHQTATVTLPTDAKVCVVYVKQLQPHAPLFADAFQLN